MRGSRGGSKGRWRGRSRPAATYGVRRRKASWQLCDHVERVFACAQACATINRSCPRRIGEENGEQFVLLRLDAYRGGVCGAHTTQFSREVALVTLAKNLNNRSECQECSGGDEQKEIVLLKSVAERGEGRGRKQARSSGFQQENEEASQG